MKLRRSTVLPLVLLVYLAVMAYIGFEGYTTGETSPAMYFGTIALTIVIIVLLHFNLKRRERLRRERENDIKNNNK